MFSVFQKVVSQFVSRKEFESMAIIIPNKNKSGKIISYKFRCCVGRDEEYKQIWRTKTVKSETLAGLTSKKLKKELDRQYDEWAEAQKADYSRSHSKFDKERITLDSFVNEHWWPDHVEDGTHTPDSIKFYNSMRADILRYFGANVRLSQIDAEMVKRYVKHLRTEAISKRGTPYSSATVQHHFSTLRNILNYAERFHYIPSNPCGDLSQREKPHREKKEIDFLVKEDALQFLHCLEQESSFWRTFGNLLIYAGLRRGEAIGLQWGDIVENKITIRRNVTMDKNSNTKRHIGQTKTKEGRIVPIGPGLRSLLQEFKHEQERSYGVLLPCAYVFCTPEDPYTPIYPSVPTKWLSRFEDRYELRKVSPHDLRHTAATLALESGADLKDIQELMGHKDATTTMQFYAGISEKKKQSVAERTEKWMAE